jgi:hypothetical protein
MQEPSAVGRWRFYFDRKAQKSKWPAETKFNLFLNVFPVGAFALGESIRETTI